MCPLASQSQRPTLPREARRCRPPAPTPCPSPSDALGPDWRRWAGGCPPHSAFPGPRVPCAACISPSWWLWNCTGWGGCYLCPVRAGGGMAQIPEGGLGKRPHQREDDLGSGAALLPGPLGRGRTRGHRHRPSARPKMPGTRMGQLGAACEAPGGPRGDGHFQV